MHCENCRAVCEGSLTGEKKSLAGSREGQKRGFKVWEGWWPGSTSPGKFVWTWNVCYFVWEIQRPRTRGCLSRDPTMFVRTSFSFSESMGQQGCGLVWMEQGFHVEDTL